MGGGLGVWFFADAAGPYMVSLKRCFVGVCV